MFYHSNRKEIEIETSLEYMRSILNEEEEKHRGERVILLTADPSA